MRAAATSATTVRVKRRKGPPLLGASDSGTSPNPNVRATERPVGLHKEGNRYVSVRTSRARIGATRDALPRMAAEPARNSRAAASFGAAVGRNIASCMRRALTFLSVLAVLAATAGVAYAATVTYTGSTS